MHSNVQKAKGMERIETSKMRTEEAGAAAMQGTLRAAWAMYSERSMSPRVSDNVGRPLPSKQCLQLYQDY